MNPNPVRTRRKVRVRKRVIIAVIAFFLILLGIVAMKLIPYIPALFQLATDKKIELKETKEKRINVLLLGIGGGTHEGPDLTDTIIFVSIDPNTPKVTMVSLPRDLWIPDLQAKINAAYTAGEDQKKGGGLAMAKQTIGDVLGQQIDYAIKIDFGGFTKAVDMMGGLNITVDNTFDDYAYPITGKEDDTCGMSEDQVASAAAQIASGSAAEGDAFPCRYEHLHFDKGPTHMDGETALKYVRSRHAFGKEGSDFARSRRQSKVISAFKDKLFSAGTLLNPVKVANLVDVLQGSIETDIKKDEYDDFVKLAQKLKGTKINSTVIDEGDSSEDRVGLLINPPIGPEYNNAWVLAPRGGASDFSQIHAYVNCVISSPTCIVTDNSVVTPTPVPTKRPSITPKH